MESNTPQSDIMETQHVKLSVVNSETDVSAVQDVEFSRSNVEALGSSCRLVDSDEKAGLDLFCYLKCDREDTTFLKQCRGLVFDGDKLIMKAFSYTPDYRHNDPETFSTIINEENFGQWSFYDSLEGAILRIFCHNGQWFISTHRKLNAFRSKWATRDSFGTLFKRALDSLVESNPDFASNLADGESTLEKFQKTLDPSKQYMFLICNNADNRIVCLPPSEPTFYHVGTFVDGELTMDEDIGVPYPERHMFTSISEVKDFFDNRVDYRYQQGLVCFGPNNSQIKIMHSDYLDLYEARGNEASIPFRYLQVRMNRRMSQMLIHLYPESVKKFDEYENILYEIAVGILASYVDRFINKNHVVVPREEYRIIRECHAWHMSDRKHNRVKIDTVISVMNKQQPTNLNGMIRRYKNEKHRKIDTNTSDGNSPVLSGLTPKMVPLLSTVPVPELSQIE